MTTTTATKSEQLKAKHSELLKEWEAASLGEKYWIGLEIDSLESKIAQFNK